MVVEILNAMEPFESIDNLVDEVFFVFIDKIW